MKTEKLYFSLYRSPAGPVHILVDEEGRVVYIGFSKPKTVPDAQIADNKAACAKVIEELEAYFGKKKTRFSIPIKTSGTAFQEKVWKALLHIPYGKTVAYSDIAKAIGHPKACRAVGTAVGKNPISIFIPCHRVLPSSGGIGNYGGGIDKKEFLLALEGCLPIR